MDERCKSELQARGLVADTQEQFLLLVEQYLEKEKSLLEHEKILKCLYGAIPLEDFSIFTQLLQKKRSTRCMQHLTSTLSLPDTASQDEILDALKAWYTYKTPDPTELRVVTQCLIELDFFASPRKVNTFLRQVSSDVCTRYITETGIWEEGVATTREEILPRLFLWYSKFGSDKVAVSRVIKCLVVLGIFETEKEAKEQLLSFSEIVKTLSSCSNTLWRYGLWDEQNNIVVKAEDLPDVKRRISLFLATNEDPQVAETVVACATSLGVFEEGEEIKIEDRDALLLSALISQKIRESPKASKCRDFFMEIGAFPKEVSQLDPEFVELFGKSVQYAYKEANILRKMRILECAPSLGAMTQEEATRKQRKLEACLDDLRERGISSTKVGQLASPSELREIEQRAKSGLWDERAERCLSRVLGEEEYEMSPEKELFEEKLQQLDEAISRSDMMAYDLLVLKILDIAPAGMLVPEVLEFGDDLSARVQLWFEEATNPILQQEVLLAAGALGVLDKRVYKKLSEQLSTSCRYFLKSKDLDSDSFVSSFGSFGDEAFSYLRVATVAQLVPQDDIQQYLDRLQPQKKKCLEKLKGDSFVPYVREERLADVMAYATHRFVVWAEAEYEASRLDEAKFFKTAGCISLANATSDSYLFGLPDWELLHEMQSQLVGKIPESFEMLQKEGVIEKDVDLTDISRVAQSINENFSRVFEEKTAEEKAEILVRVAASGIAESKSLEKTKEEIVQEGKKEEENPFLITTTPPQKLPSGVKCTIGTDGRYYWFLKGKRTRERKEWDRKSCMKREFLKTTKKPKKIPKGMECVKGEDGMFCWIKKGKLVR